MLAYVGAVRVASGPRPATTARSSGAGYSCRCGASPPNFRYRPRRVECAEHGVVVEYIPWSDGKRPVTCAMMGFLARWARRLSWRDTARVFLTSWEAVYRSVEWFVEWGLAHRRLDGVESIGVDEIHWGRRRSQATLRRGRKALGPEFIRGLRFVCSDMWKPYLQVIAAQAGQALHILDRFHITGQLNQAVDEVRRAESTRLRAKSKPAASGSSACAGRCCAVAAGCGDGRGKSSRHWRSEACRTTPLSTAPARFWIACAFRTSPDVRSVNSVMARRSALHSPDWPRSARRCCCWTNLRQVSTMTERAPCWRSSATCRRTAPPWC